MFGLFTSLFPYIVDLGNFNLSDLFTALILNLFSTFFVEFCYFDCPFSKYYFARRKAVVLASLLILNYRLFLAPSMDV